MKRVCLGVSVVVSAGIWLSAHAIEVARNVVVEGTGEDQTRQRTEPVMLQPNTCYAFTCALDYAGDKGVAVTGPDCARMYLNIRRDGLVLTNIFVTAAGNKPIPMRFECGQWHMPGKAIYKTADVYPVTPVYTYAGDVELGYGERMDGNTYTLDAPFKSKAVNHSRMDAVLTQAEVSGSGWQIRTGGSVEMRHKIGARTIEAAQFSALVGICPQGASLVVESSWDGGKTWQTQDTCTTVTCARASLDLRGKNVKEVRVRLRNTAKKGTIRVSRYAFHARVDGPALFAFGATSYKDEAGRILLELKHKPYLSDISGALLPGGDSTCALWQDSSARKIFRGRPLPTEKAKLFTLTAARNEAESKQLVVTPQEDLADVRVASSDLVMRTGLFGLGEKKILKSDAVSIGRVGYLTINFTMDNMGAAGRWPDPIFEQDASALPVRKGENQPIWIRVKPPKGTAAGIYSGTLTVTLKNAAGVTSVREVPFDVQVYDFDFPDEITCQTAFGLGFSRFIIPYQRLKTREDKLAVAHKYHALLADHHISPCSPDVMAPCPTWNVKWTKTANPADAEPIFDWAPWDAAMEKVFSTYHFNSFRISIQGLGSCDVTKSHPPRFCGYDYTNALFHARMSKYLKGIESHLAEKGWLDKAYVYTFDEPLEKDYGLVMQGLGLVAKYAPRLRRMLTAPPRQRLMPGGANLWCPLTREDLQSPEARQARAAGDDFWWYITFSSEAPLVNEHVEHAGVDMRLWGWQTFAQDVHGVLIWELAYWNGWRTYPKDVLQNPYDDAMCWTRIWHPWNSGEGRYIYPPKACFNGGTDPVLEGPVDSIRFEMLREGLEDYEYLVMLKRKDPKSPLLAMPESIERNDRDYSTDPRGMEAQREKIAQVLEKGLSH